MNKIIKLFCPICGNNVIADLIPTINFNGKEYMFYCECCKKKFLIKEFNL